jgi:hypothetical protein
VIEGGKIQTKPVSFGTESGFRPVSIPDDVVMVDAPKLYLYSVREEASREISFEDTQILEWVAGPASPDGYTVTYEYNDNGIFGLFGSETNSGYVISKGAARKNLPGITSNNYYYGGGFQLIGWAKYNAYE